MHQELGNTAAVRILICEDELLFAENLASTLGDLGYEIVGTVMTGQRAISIVEEIQPDMILMDIGLAGEIDGVEAARCIRAQFDIPLVYLTAYAEEDVFDRAKSTGPYGYLRKPFSLIELKCTLETTLCKHQIDKQIRESEARRAKAEELAGLYSWEWDFQTGHFVWSEQSYRIFGLNPHETKLVFETFINLVHPEDKDRLRDALRDAKDGKRPYEIEFRIVQPSGQERILHSRGEIRRDRRGRAVRMHGMTLDVTDRKKAEKALQETKNRYLQAVENSPNAILAVDAEGKILSWNDSCERITGYAKAQAIGNSAFDLILRTEQMRVADIICEVFRGCSFNDIPLDFYAKNGTVRKMISRAYPLMDANGKVLECMLANTDITELNASQEELRRSEERYRRIVETANEGIWAMDGEFRTTFVNRRMAEMLGYSAEEMLGRTVDSFMFQEDLGDHETKMEERRRGTNQIYERRFRCKNNTALWTTVSATALMDGKGNFAGSFAMFTDITKRKKAEEALQEREQQNRSLYSMVRLICDNVPDLVWAKDLEGKFTFVNRAMCEKILHAHDTDEPIGKNDLFFAERERASHPEDPHWHDFGCIRMNSDQAIVDSQTAQRFDEFGTIRGEFLHLDIYQAPFLNERGEIVGTVGCGRDVTKERAIEESLRQSESRYRDLFDNALDVIYTHDLEGNYTSVNGAAKRLLGYSEEEFLDLNFRDIVTPEYLATALSHFHRKLRDKEDKTELYELLVRAKDGSHRWVEVVSRLVRRDGQPIAIHGTARDISDRKILDDALRKSEQFLRQTEQIARVGGWITNPLTNALHLTDGIRRIAEMPFDYEPDLEEGLKFFMPQYVPMIREMLIDTLENGTSHIMEAELITASNKRLWIEIRSLMRVDESSGPQVLGTLQDITDRKQAEAALKASEQILDRILAASPVGIGLSHMRKMRWVNDAWTRLFGFENRSECKGQDAMQLYPSREDFLRAGTILYKNLASGVVNATDAKMRRKDGSEFDALIRMAALDPSDLNAGQIAVIMDISDRKAVERALEKSEAMLSGILHAAQIGIGVTDDRTLSWTNQMLSRITGYSAAELTGQSARMLYPSDEEFDRVGTVKYRDIAETGIGQLETQWKRKDGEIIDVFLSSVPMVPEDLSKGVVFTGQDITDRKRAEQALRESEEKYRATFNNVAVGIDVVDHEGRFQKVNDTLSSLLGYSEKELLGLTIFDVTHPGDIQESSLRHAALMRGELDTYRYDKRYVCKDGSIIWADTSVSAIRDNNGKPVAAVGVISDITRRRKSEAVRLRLATAVEQAAETIEITDPNGTIVYVNPAFERITGYSREEAIGKNPRILKSDHHDDRFYSTMWETIAAGKVWRGHFINKTKAGTLFEEEVSISPITDKTGKIINYVAVKRDVTREQSLQAQLRQAQKMEAIGTLAGGIAHDFNNLLQITLGYSEMLLADKKETDPEYADLQKIFDAASSGAELVKGLLTFSRKVGPKPVTLNLNRQITEVEKLLRRTIPKMIDIETELADDLAEINADPAQIQQMLMNLVVNARDAMADSGRLKLATKNIVLNEGFCSTHVGINPGPFVLLQVSDTGHGMDTGTIEHIFEPFYTTKEVGRGTGLGLATVYGIVNQHGGIITCESEIGRGTTFSIYFPAFSMDERLWVNRPETTAEFGTEAILLVDDEDMVRDLGVRILSKAGYTVLTANNGQNALDVFKKESSLISLVILDLIMPELGGKDCLPELLKIKPEIKVLIASGYAADAATQECVQLGAKGFVAKPFRLEELLKNVRKTLDENSPIF
jgi:PAS domain S-box-containing protein